MRKKSPQICSWHCSVRQLGAKAPSPPRAQNLAVSPRVCATDWRRLRARWGPCQDYCAPQKAQVAARLPPCAISRPMRAARVPTQSFPSNSASERQSTRGAALACSAALLPRSLRSASQEFCPCTRALWAAWGRGAPAHAEMLCIRGCCVWEDVVY